MSVGWPAGKRTETCAVADVLDARHRSGCFRYYAQLVKPAGTVALLVPVPLVAPCESVT